MNCYIRADANEIIGIGHLVRTEILADELSGRGFDVTFLCKTIPEKFCQKILLKGYRVEMVPLLGKELPYITEVILNSDQNVLVVDSDIEEFYTEEFQRTIRRNNIRLMMITFYNQYHYYADVVLNQNIMALSQTYDSEVYTQKLLGPQYVILKAEYQKISKNLSHYKNKLDGKTVLLTFGGIDEPDRTSFVYKSLIKTLHSPAKIIIVLGAMYKYKADLEKIIEISPIKTEVYQDTPQMPYLLAEANIVFNSGGLTVWESGALGALNIIMGYSEREKIGGLYAGENGYAIYLGSKQDYSVQSLADTIDTILCQNNQKYISKLSECIDVYGVNKVADVIENIL
ncbi:spore coat polysaccharide biosynthesis protein, putative glycosyltransferase [Desulfocapsa sulfexigens DSM 10523]|uniref:Spore coat polysaccharide biosynthesis protein, putative glycosyltransferase n=1 Tax=Desulfocapsa sulfexigens (strain DSM 10523 / SB164P1) TaxID=1167006 RepID=M1PRH5_DESSD|nr:spore coat polysaccharide biosynthesis protein glycosyltransferase [Desulfocapsa sulfexigens]AGF78956.1 spore coat polysaccharide biosynthesis protein, putative glycosyltransferase [Desulfocapsa sulfexigens DSM 10523]